MKTAQTKILRFPTNNYFNKLLLLLRVIGLEAAIWIGALLYLAYVHTPGETHYAICPINNMGFDFCPGCGLGNSISLFFQGEMYNSFLSHPLGLLALTVLIIRIIQLIKNNWSNYGKHLTTNALS
jgi:hypothetical protein